VLIVVSGLQGTGKSTVAAALAHRWTAVHLSVDQVEDAMLGAGLPHAWTTGVAAYEVVRAATEQNLALGRVVVVDAVNDSADARQTWTRAAEASGSSVRFAVLTPPEESEHRRRLERRDRGLRHLPEPRWDEVEARATEFEPWDVDCIVVDSAQPVDAVVSEIAAAVGTDAPGA
jgi:predicted kinase